MKNRLIAVVLSFAAAALMTGCGSNEKSDAIRIGAILPLTGDYADVGNWMQTGMKLALDEINANREKKITVIYEDSQSKAAVGVKAYRKLKDVYGIRYFISTVTPVCLALKPLVVADENFMLVNAGHRELTSEKTPTIFRHALTMTQEAKFLATEVIKRQKSSLGSSFCFVYANNDIGLEVRDVFLKEMPMTPLLVLSYEESDKDMKNLSAQIISRNPDFVVICGYTKNLGVLIKNIRENSYMKPIYVNQGFSTPSVKAVAGKYGINVFYSDYAIPESAGINHLKDELRVQFSSALSPHSITAYNALKVIANATDRSPSKDPLSVSSAIKQNAPYDINGMKLEINNIGDIYVPLILVENIPE